MLPLLLRADGRPINKSSELQEVIGCSKPGDKVTITLYRKGKEKHIDILLEKQPARIGEVEDEILELFMILEATQYNANQIHLALAFKYSWNSFIHGAPLDYIVYFTDFSIPAFYPAQIARIVIAENFTQIKRTFNGVGFHSAPIANFVEPFAGIQKL